MTISDTKYYLDVCEKMIDRLQRELYSNGSMMNAVNSAYESLSDTEKENYKTKRQMLNKLLTYRTQLLDYALGIMTGTIPETEPSITNDIDFNFSL